MAGDWYNTSTSLPWNIGPNTFYPTNWTGGWDTQFTASRADHTHPAPAPTYQFNIVILANGQKLPLDSDDLAAKIGQAIAAAFQTKEDQHTLEDLAE
jgi:hypothetical protein